MPALTALLALSLLLAHAGASRVARARRVGRQNEWMHELRRPLAELALRLGEDPSVELAAWALEGLDASVNGSRPPLRSGWGDVGPFELGDELRGAIERTELIRGAAGTVELAGRGSARVEACRVSVRATLENLLLNALEHGLGAVRVSLRVLGTHVEVEVANPVLDQRAMPSEAADPRRGHGLEVARLGARAAGGELVCEPRQGEVAWTLRLPLARPALRA